MPSPVEVQQLRADNYNATVTRVVRIHDDLMLLRAVCDAGPLAYSPGQYVVIGLGNWERRVAGVQQELLTPAQQRELIKRAYSISSPLLDADGQLVPTCGAELEFYLALVRFAERHPPALTPRLFALREGDRLFIGPRARGRYTLEGVQPHDQVIFVATGTGEAPHNAMLVELLRDGHPGFLVSVVCTRYQRDLAYLAQHHQLEQRFANYRYIPLTTREPCNLDAARPDYVGKYHVQEFFASGRFEQYVGLTLDPARTHVYLCGNPGMIGAPSERGGQRAYPQPTGMVELLERKGFQIRGHGHSGNLHFETYWSTGTKERMEEPAHTA